MVKTPSSSDFGRDAVAIILAIGLATAVNLITLASLWVAVADKTTTGGLSENATQVLTTAFGGIIGVLGAVFGYRAGAQQGLDDGLQRNRDSEPGPG